MALPNAVYAWLVKLGQREAGSIGGSALKFLAANFTFEFPGPVVVSGADGMALVIQNNDAASLDQDNYGENGAENGVPSQLSVSLESYRGGLRWATLQVLTADHTGGRSLVASRDLRAAPFNIPDVSDAGVHTVEVRYAVRKPAASQTPF